MEEAIKEMEENMKIVVDQKMEIKLWLADIVDWHNIYEQATMWKMNKTKNMLAIKK